MAEVKNLYDQDAISKLQDLAKDIDICMFCTRTGDLPVQTRPMSTNSVDAEGNIWFISSKASNKNSELKQDSKVQLIYSKPNDAHFLSVTGKAHVITDRKKINDLWNSSAKAWFPEGKEDPDVSLIKVVPGEAKYWDTKHGKMISLLKIATAAVTGQPGDIGVEGKLHP